MSNRIESKSVLLTYGCSAYNNFAFENELELIKLVKEHKRGIYHINNVNNYHSLLKDFLRKFKGVSSRYLNEYLSWFKFIRQKNDTDYLYKDVLLG